MIENSQEEIILAFVGISLKNNKEQQELARLINENHRPIILCTGNAGTGKTFAALATKVLFLLIIKFLI